MTEVACAVGDPVVKGADEQGDSRAPGSRGLLLHVSGSDESQLRAGIRAARNARAQLPGLIMEIVVQGPAVAFLHADSALGAELAELGAASIEVLACGNSLRAISMEPEELFREVIVVTAAVAHLTTRQFDGWAYVRV